MALQLFLLPREHRPLTLAGTLNLFGCRMWPACTRINPTNIEPGSCWLLTQER